MKNRLKVILCIGVFLLMLLPAVAISMPYLGNNDTEEKAIVLGGSGHPGQGGGKKDPADLTITNIFTIPSTPVGGESVTIYAKIENIGDLDVKDRFTSTLYIDGYWAETKYLDGLIGGGSAYISKTVTLDPGYHELDAIADIWDDVKEADEDNNQRIENILWEGGSPTYPDLIVTSVVVYNDVTNGIINSVYSGWPIRISATVKNNGDAPAGASVVELRDILGGSPTVMGTASVPALAIGATYTAIFDDKYISSIGTHTIRAVADSTGVVTESSETNNAYDKTNFVVSLSKWTVGVYMDADEYLDEYANPPTTLELAAIGDIDEMKLAGSLYGSLNIIVILDMFDGEGSYSFTGARIYLVQYGGLYQMADLGEVNMGDPDTLNDFITTYSLGRFKASQSMLILWDHGGGCIGGLFEDQHPTNVDNVMSLPEMDSAIPSTIHVDILAFHACLMSSVEVGFEMDYGYPPKCDIIVGFEDVQHFDGFPYGCSASYTDGIFNYMRQYPTASDVSVAHEMVDRTYRSYQSGGSQDAPDDYDDYLAVAAFHAADNLENLGLEINDVGYTMYISEDWYEAYWARHACEDFASPATGGWTPTDWQGFYVDVKDFMSELMIMADATNNWDLYYSAEQVLDELMSITILAKFGSYHSNCGGIHLYFPQDPYDRDLYDTTYATLDMSHTLWDEFINEFPYTPY